MQLSDLIRRQNNNADVLRLVAALAVIWGHAYFLAPKDGLREPVGVLLGFDYSGSLAVKIFFFISGLFVTNSLIERASIVEFVSSRFFRIIPALVVSAVICTLIIGPLMTTVSLPTYFHDGHIANIIFVHPFLDYQLPGVFKNNPYPQINGSLWTIQYELMLYVMLLGISMTGLLRSRIIGSSICVLTILIAYFDPNFISYLGLDYGSEGRMLPAFFAFGALLAINKNYIEINGRVLIGLLVIAICLRTSSAFRIFFLAAFVLGALYLTTTEAVRSIKLPGDYSYGVYVYGWPAQQVLRSHWPQTDIHVNQVATAAIALVLAVGSWHLVERPCVLLGKWLAARISRTFALGVPAPIKLPEATALLVPRPSLTVGLSTAEDLGSIR